MPYFTINVNYNHLQLFGFGFLKIVFFNSIIYSIYNNILHYNNALWLAAVPLAG